MIYDPLYEFLRQTGVSPLPLALGYGFSFILSMMLIKYVAGGKKSLNEYLKDPLGTFLWPFFVLAPLVVFYLLVSELGFNIDSQFKSLGLTYAKYNLGFQHSKPLFWIIVTLATIEGVENVYRYHRSRPNLWLSKPKYLQPISTVLFNIPLGIMAFALAFKIIDQWVVFHNFMTSGWLPSTVYNSDEMYGLRWLYSILITQMIIAVVASFSTLLILIREGKQRYSWIYKVIFALCILCTSYALYSLSAELNSLFQIIHSHFLNFYFNELNHFVHPSNLTLGQTLQKTLLFQEISIITELPSKMPIPNWLNGIIGLRLLIFIPEIYTALAKPLGWKKIPLNIKKILDVFK